VTGPGPSPDDGPPRPPDRASDHPGDGRLPAPAPTPRPAPRVRVRSTDPPPGGTDPARAVAPSGTPPARTDNADDGASHYTRGLVRAQLRLGLACVVSFLAVVALLTLTMSAVPALDQVVVLGVPLPWLVHAYGFYPVIVAFGVVFAVAAARNERRYAALADGAAGPDDGGAP